MPIAGARVDFYLQGATAVAGVTIGANATHAIEVDGPGALYDGAIVRVGATGAFFTVSSVDSQAQVTLKNDSESGLTIPGGARLLLVSARPTAYQDALGTLALGTTVTCDSGGRAQVFLPEGQYDYLVTDPTETGVVPGAPTTPATLSAAIDSFSWSHTVAAGQQLLLVAVSWQESLGSETLDSVSYGSTAMTRAGSALFADLYYLLNPPTGSDTVTVRFSGSSQKAAVGVSIAVANVDTTMPFASARPTAGPGTIGGTNEAGALPKAWAFGVLGVNTVPGTTTVTPDASVTSLWNQSIGSTGALDRTQAAGASRTPNGTAVGITWSISPSRAWGAVTVEVVPPALYKLVTDATALGECQTQYGILATTYVSLQAAIDALPNQGGVIYVPAGTYRQANGLIIAKPNVTLIGEGVTTVITPADPVNHPIDLITIRASEVRISRLKIDGAATAMDLDSGHCGIVYDGDDHGTTAARLVQHCFLENVVVTGNAKHGLWLKDTILMTAINCEVVQNPGGGMRIQGGEEGGVCSTLRFLGCAFSANGWIGVDIGDDIPDYSGMEQISLWGCTMENNQGGPTLEGRSDIGVNINANQCLKVEVVSCYFEGPPQADHEHYDPATDGCAQMVRLKNCPNAVVRDCRLNGTLATGQVGATYGFLLLGSSYAEVVSNVAQGVTDDIIKFDSGCDDCVEMCNRDLDPDRGTGLPRIVIEGRGVFATSRSAVGLLRIFNTDGYPPTGYRQIGSLLWVDNPDGSDSKLQIWDGGSWKSIALT